MSFIIKQRGKVVAKAKTWIEAQGKVNDLCMLDIPTNKLSKAQLAQMVFMIEEV